MSTVVVGTVRSNSSNPPAIQNTSGTEIGTFCRAWVNWNGGTNVGGFCTIRSSFNVTSVTDNAVGDYTVTFTNAMPDANYAAVFGTTWQSGTALNTMYAADTTTARTTTALRVYATCNTGASNSAQDPLHAQVAIFR